MAFRMTDNATHNINFGHLSGLDGVQKFSLGFALKYNTLASRRFFQQIDGSNNGLWLNKEGGGWDWGMRFGNGSANEGASASQSMTTGVWYYFLLVYDGALSGDWGRAKLYWNSSTTPVSWTYQSGTPPATLGNSGAANFYMGATDFSPGVDVAKLAMWIGTAITDTGIIAALTPGADPQTVAATGLTHYWPLSADADGDVGGINGTVTGGSWVSDPPADAAARRVRKLLMGVGR